mgnify:CR=1 FL=1
MTVRRPDLLDTRRLRLLRELSVRGTIAGVAQYDDERDELLQRGADVAFHIYEGTGVGLADAAAEAAGLER